MELSGAEASALTLSDLDDWASLACLGSVKTGIEAENWPQVIQDYRKAKLLFATTDNEIFQKVC